MVNTVTLKKNFEFARVYKKGKFYVGKFIILYVLNNNHNINRIGIVASKKIGKSVKRNRYRRLIRESYRLYEVFVGEGHDFVFVSKPSPLPPGFLEVKKEMKFLLKKLGVFDQEKWDC